MWRWRFNYALGGHFFSSPMKYQFSTFIWFNHFFLRQWLLLCLTHSRSRFVRLRRRTSKISWQHRIVALFSWNGDAINKYVIYHNSCVIFEQMSMLWLHHKFKYLYYYKATTVCCHMATPICCRRLFACIVYWR